MKPSFTASLFFLLIFSGFMLCLFTTGCKQNSFSKLNNTVNDSLAKAMWNCCPPTDSAGLRTPPGVVCPESPGNMNVIAFIKHQYDNGHLSLAYYPVLTPKVIHVLDSLNTARGPAAPDYYIFTFETDSARYGMPISKIEIDSGKLTIADSIILSKVKIPPCYYPHCIPTKVQVIDTLPQIK